MLPSTRTYNDLTDDQGTRQLVTETVSVEKAYRHTMNNKRSEDRMHCKTWKCKSYKHKTCQDERKHDTWLMREAEPTSVQI